MIIPTEAVIIVFFIFSSNLFRYIILFSAGDIQVGTFMFFSEVQLLYRTGAIVAGFKISVFIYDFISRTDPFIINILFGRIFQFIRNFISIFFYIKGGLILLLHNKWIN